MKDQATKYGEARKTKSCGCQNTHPVHNTSPTIKASKVHHQKGLLEASKKIEKGGDDIPSGHHETHE